MIPEYLLTRNLDYLNAMAERGGWTTEGYFHTRVYKLERVADSPTSKWHLWYEDSLTGAVDSPRGFRLPLAREAMHYRLDAYVAGYEDALRTQNPGALAKAREKNSHTEESI
tara:strand:+ start:552 stop:887 length:336 start_codon:yes stop_codon:yes gene_type:complete